MSKSTMHAEQQLLHTGAIVEFRVLDAQTELSPDKENVSVRVDLVFIGVDDDDDTDP
ncbi:MAG: hypothetical protein GQ538_00665, partial [Xanthomonadales bacterium]|nr:hypothetical protein [Xanthomonadales bacterium]